MMKKPFEGDLSHQAARRAVRAQALIAVPIALLVAIVAYRGGLSGPFLFDDWANLPALGHFGRIDNWDAFWRYVTSGTADPTGRPVSMLSFLLDADDWPAEPGRFKYTNLLLHLLNGLLLWWLLLRLDRLLGLKEAPAFWVAALAAMSWLLHPFWVSTVLYVVQRQAMLVATWTLLGLLLYVAGRERLQTRPGRAFGLMSLGVGGGTLLGVLSKGNGALIPLFTLLLEALILTPACGRPAGRAWRFWSALFLWLPAGLVLAYLASHAFRGFDTPIAFRSFTLGERLLTESRILWDYLRLLWLPRPYTTGLFNDAYPLSTSLFHPWTTLVAVTGLAGLGAIAFAVRRRFPVLAFGIGFFLAGHLLESTVIPLELYFEHRNYTPALFLFWPLSMALVCARKISLPVKTVLAVGAMALLAVFTALRADLWGRPDEQAHLWAELNPASPRAQTQAAIHDNRRGNHVAAIARLEPLLEAHPDSAQAALTLLSARCGLGRVDATTLDRAAYALKQDRLANGVLFGWMEKTIRAYASGGDCAGMDAAALTGLLDAAQSNPAFGSAGGRQNLAHLRGLLALELGDGEGAARYFTEAVEADPKPGAVLSEAALLGGRGFPRLGLDLLDFGYGLWRGSQKPRLEMAYVHYLVLRTQGYWEHEFRHLRKILEQDIDAKRAR